MLMPACDRVSNILLATPTCERMPMPTAETLATLSLPITATAPTAGAMVFFTSSIALLYSERFTVNEKSVVPSLLWFWMIMSTSMFAAAIGPKMPNATPGVSGT